MPRQTSNRSDPNVFVSDRGSVYRVGGSDNVDRCAHGAPLYGPKQDCIECELIWYRGLLDAAQRNVTHYQDKIAALEAK